VKCLENVRYRFDDKLQEFQPNLMRTKFKHGYDAMAQYGHGYGHRAVNVSNQNSENEMARVNRTKARRVRGKGAGPTSRKGNWRT
jgi:hypothetical protein